MRNSTLSTTLEPTRNKTMKILTIALRTAALGTAMIASQAQAALYYFHNDHLGTPQVVTDTAGEVVWEGQYSPFGEVVETTADVQQDLRFPGQLLDRETGLHYNYFRDYDPGMGRYIESDPIGLADGSNTFGKGIVM